MSHTRVKTTYSVMGSWGSTETQELYCHHNHSTDFTTFHNSDGSLVDMVFHEWESGNDLWDAMNRLWFPFKDKWGGELKEGVEYYYNFPDEKVEFTEPATCPACQSYEWSYWASYNKMKCGDCGYMEEE